MRFWDTSALIPRMLDEPRSPEMRHLLAEDDRIVAAGISAIEVASAIWRRRHDGELSPATLGEADGNFAELSLRWSAINYTAEITDLALDLLSRYRIRTLDAIQLATAKALTKAGAAVDFVTLDQRLASAARAEAFPPFPDRISLP